MTPTRRAVAVLLVECVEQVCRDIKVETYEGIVMRTAPHSGSDPMAVDVGRSERPATSTRGGHPFRGRPFVNADLIDAKCVARRN
jgi:hypothetical protein